MITGRTGDWKARSVLNGAAGQNSKLFQEQGSKSRLHSKMLFNDGNSNNVTRPCCPRTKISPTSKQESRLHAWIGPFQKKMPKMRNRDVESIFMDVRSQIMCLQAYRPLVFHSTWMHLVRLRRSMNDCGVTFRGKFRRAHCLIWTISLVQQGFFRLQIPKMDHLGVAETKNSELLGQLFAAHWSSPRKSCVVHAELEIPKIEKCQGNTLCIVKCPVESKIFAMESRQHSSVVTNSDIFSWPWTGPTSGHTPNSCEITCIHVSYICSICMLLAPCILQRFFQISPPSRETTSAKSPLSHLH